MNAGLDFALAQVRDRDLVIESLREQLEVATELGPLYRKWQEAEVKREAAEAEVERLRKELADARR